jgi:hypothetical protein
VVFAVLQSKQLATLPFELIAAVKNTTPRVGCAEPAVISNGFNPGRLLNVRWQRRKTQFPDKE